MNELFVMIFPCVVGFKIIKRKKVQNVFSDIIDFFEFCLCPNFLLMVILYWKNNFIGNLISYINENMFFALKYIISNFVLSIILALVVNFVKDNISIKIETIKELK